MANVSFSTKSYMGVEDRVSDVVNGQEEVDGVIQAALASYEEAADEWDKVEEVCPVFRDPGADQEEVVELVPVTIKPLTTVEDVLDYLTQKDMTEYLAAVRSNVRSKGLFSWLYCTCR